MKVKYIKLLSFLSTGLIFFTGQTYAQTFEGNLSLNSQNDVDNFSYTSVTGNLTIDDFVSPITNLNGLSELTSVGGNLLIDECEQLTSISGLSNITNVGGNITFDRANALTSLQGFPSALTTINSLTFGGMLALVNFSGLENITTINGDLTFSHMLNTSSLTGLDNLTYIGGDFSVHNFSQLTNFDVLSGIIIAGSLNINSSYNLLNLNAFSAITSLGGNLGISTNSSLSDISGLSNITTVGGDVSFHDIPVTDLSVMSSLTSIGGDLRLSALDNLTNIDALTGLTSIPGTLFLWVNDVLTNIDGLSNIASVGEDVRIDDLPALIDINGLSSLTSVGDDLTITNNTSLTNFCGINPLIVSGGLTGSLTITGNASNPTIEEILLAGPCEYSDPGGIIDELPLNDGNKNALASKLQRALDAYNRGQYIAAENILDALLNQLNQLITGGSISETDAQDLLGYIEYLMNLIDSKLPKMAGAQLPEKYALNQNFPNPFNPSTIISYQVPINTNVEISIFNSLGEKIVDLVNEIKQAGYYEVDWNAAGLPSGIYMYRIVAGDYTSVQKMILMK